MVVIGGGNVAMDCAVTAKLLGAETAIYYRRSIEEAPAEMEELEHVLHLGVSITTGFAPAEVTGNGKVEGMKFKGRDGVSEATVACDTVVFAIGQGAEAVPAPVAVNEKGLVVVNGSKTNVEGIFAGGDIAHGGKTVVEAVAAGKVAAFEIAEYLK